MKEVKWPFETSVDFQRPIRLYIPGLFTIAAMRTSTPKFYPSICAEKQRKYEKSYCNCCPQREWKGEPSEYEFTALPFSKVICYFCTETSLTERNLCMIIARES
jgi:hypothetical protein